jgi:hypothetical protein
MTITVLPNVAHRCRKRHFASVARSDAVEDLIQRRLSGIGNQPAPKVFLQGLMRACSSLAQDPVSLLRNIFDLHAWHGAIMALPAP